MCTLTGIGDQLSNPKKSGIRVLSDPDGSIEKRDLLFFDVPLLLQKLSEPRFPLREGSPSNEAGELDTVVFVNFIQHDNVCSVPEENPLGIHCY